ncbi:XRE family transcriptional regulator [Pseudidiomarina sp. CB1]|uniref:helix-turn-helix domain-containing protein n=1 Tax=Pseudidiomarina sp. CB1 TaxID=2972484 RepID=UPI0021628E30|nr:XRE family transcriptional regulator [Pseudidiomarina sp. CB1]
MDRQTEQQQLIAQRITYFRKARGLKQQELSDLLAFNQRQTLSDIERGERQVKPTELALFAKALDVKPMAFLDAFEPAVDVEFSWRTNDENTALAEFEQRGRNIINLLTTLRRKLNIAPASISSLPLGERNSYEDAQNAAEKLVAEFDLGPYPGKVLHKLYEALNVDCIYLDLPKFISGAAMVSDEALLAVINANEVRGRRNFDKAHELFHCLTWRTMKPMHIDRVQIPRSNKRSRIEQLADAFAGALLMPAESLLKVLPEEISLETLTPIANGFEVSVDAVIWRLVSMKRISSLDAQLLLKQERIPGNGNSDNLKPHALLSRSYLLVLAKGIENGLVSVRRASTLLNISIDALHAAFQQHDLETPFDM